MTDLNKMFPEFTKLDFSKNDVIILPFDALENIEYNCPNELRGAETRYLQELEEFQNSVDCEKCSCKECWQRASKIVMEHYFGKWN